MAQDKPGRGEAFDVAQVPLSMVRTAGDLIFVSGQIPMEDGRLMTGDIEAQTDRTLATVEHHLEEAGSSLSEVIKVSVFLAHAKRDFPAMNEVYGRYFPKAPRPARTTMGVELAVDVLIEVEAIAVRGLGT